MAFENSSTHCPIDLKLCLPRLSRPAKSFKSDLSTMHVLVLPRGYEFDFYLMCLSDVTNSTKHFPMAGVMDLPSAQMIDFIMHAFLASPRSVYQKL